jgi:heat shock protein HslJ
MTDKVEQVFRDGLADLVRDKPDLGPIDLDEVVARSRLRHSRRAPTGRWLTVAAVLVVLVGTGIGLWFGAGERSGPRVIDAQPASPADPLVGTRWLVSQIGGEPALFDAQGHVPFLAFEGKGDVVGSARCNLIRGSYELLGDRLTFIELSITERACNDAADVDRQHGEYIDALEITARLAIDDTTLTLFDYADDPVLVFHAAPDPSPAPVTDVQVRVRNDSAIDFEQVRVTFARGRVDYGALPSGQYSDYRRAEWAFKYAGIRVIVDGKELTRGVTDYMGETPLPPGRYTYVLNADTGSLDLRLEVDQ